MKNLREKQNSEKRSCYNVKLQDRAKSSAKTNNCWQIKFSKYNGRKSNRKKYNEANTVSAVKISKSLTEPDKKI